MMYEFSSCAIEFPYEEMRSILPTTRHWQWQMLAHQYLVLVLRRTMNHDDVIKWKHFPLYWSFVRGIHRGPANCPHKGQWRRALMFSSTCVWINGWVNHHEAGDLRRHRAHYDVTVMQYDVVNLLCWIKSQQGWGASMYKSKLLCKDGFHWRLRYFS